MTHEINYPLGGAHDAIRAFMTDLKLEPADRDALLSRSMFVHRALVDSSNPLNFPPPLDTRNIKDLSAKMRSMKHDYHVVVVDQHKGTIHVSDRFFKQFGDQSHVAKQKFMAQQGSQYKFHVMTEDQESTYREKLEDLVTVLESHPEHTTQREEKDEKPIDGGPRPNIVNPKVDQEVHKTGKVAAQILNDRITISVFALTRPDQKQFLEEMKKIDTQIIADSRRLERAVLKEAEQKAAAETGTVREIKRDPVTGKILTEEGGRSRSGDQSIQR